MRARRIVIRGVLLYLALAAFAGAGASAQTLSGRVTTRDGTPLGRVVLEVLVPPNWVSTVTVSADGTYRITVPSGARTAQIRLAGTPSRFQPASMTIALDSTVTEQHVADLVLTGRPQTLPTVRSAVRPRPVREDVGGSPRPGERSQTFDPSLTLAGDLLGDPEFALSGVPGVQVAIDPSGGPPRISLAGLGTELNRTTLNRSPASDNPPRDAAVLQILLNSYDPARAASAVVTNWTLLSATFLPIRRLHATMSAPAMQWTTTAGRELGARTYAPIISGNFAGPGRSFVRMVNTSFQFSDQEASVPTFLSATPAGAAALGITPDVVARVRGALPAFGITVDPFARVTRRSVRASVFTRLDLTTSDLSVSTSNADGTLSVANGGTDGDVGYVILGGTGGQARGLGASASALPLYTSASDRWSVTGQGAWSHFSHSGFLLDSRLAASASGGRASPTSDIPGAGVLLADELGAGANAIALLGGSNAAHRTETHALVHGMTVARWKSFDGRHEYEIEGEANAERVSSSRGTSAGSFAYASLDGYLANTPASFTRRLDSARVQTHAVRGALALGDIYRASDLFSAQYGVRIEHEALFADRIGSPLVDSIFGRNAHRLPRWTAVSPMAGFTWLLGRDAYGFADGSRSVIGGIRDYRGALPLDVVIAQPGFGATSSGMAVLRCAGAAAPIPDWRGYANRSVTLPTQCAGDDASPLRSEAPDADLYAHGFTVGHSWRGDLSFDYRLTNQWFATLHGMWAENTAQSLPYDLNFSGTVRATLPAEGDRPLFVSPAAIVPGTGTVAASESRRFAQLASVVEHRSAGRGQAGTVGLTMAYRPRFSFFSSGVQTPMTVDYTLADIRAQTNGFASTTAGDPRPTDWMPGLFSRHTLLVWSALRIPDAFTFSLGVQLRSGIGFTPLVGGDINGDGLANDRAFVFSPQDTSVSGYRELVNRLSPEMRRCVESQIGGVARVNSCHGPWSATANAAFAIDPYRIRLQNRGSVRLVLSNLAAGLDLLLHGPAKTHGWGQAAFPDPVLYVARGFAPGSNRFQYAANQRFGSSEALRAAFANPFRVSIDVSIDIGESRESRAMKQRLAAPANEPLEKTAIAGRLAWRGPDLFAQVVRLADSLRLSRGQLDSLDRWSSRHAVYRDSVYDDLADFLAERKGDFGGNVVQQRWHNAIAAVQWHEWSYRDPLLRLLKPEQAPAIFSERRPAVSRLLLMDKEEATRFLARWFYAPY
jgi:hypothetical protein